MGEKTWSSIFSLVHLFVLVMQEKNLNEEYSGSWNDRNWNGK